MIFLTLPLIRYRGHDLGKLILDSNNNVLSEVTKASVENNTIASGIQMDSSNVSKNIMEDLKTAVEINKESSNAQIGETEIQALRNQLENLKNNQEKTNRNMASVFKTLERHRQKLDALPTKRAAEEPAESNNKTTKKFKKEPPKTPAEEIAELRKVNKSVCMQRSEENKKHNQIADENRVLKDENEKLRIIIKNLNKEKAELKDQINNLEQIKLKEQFEKIDAKEFEEDIPE